MKELRIAILLLLTTAFVVTFSNTREREKPRAETIPAVTIERSDLKSDLEERYELTAANRASRARVVASVSTITLPTPTTLHGETHKSQPVVTTAPKRVTASPTIDKPKIPVGDIWVKLAQCESGMNQRATSSSGAYLGFFQFSRTTWASVGGPGDPRDHDYITQLRYAQILQARSGFRSQWPACSRKLGLT